MSLLKNLARIGRRLSGNHKNSVERAVDDAFRHCRFEKMEPRQMLSADPIQVGGVYIEDDSGTDSNPDTFYVSFEGGSDSTQLSQIVIDGNQDGDAGSLNSPDVYFDTADGGRGVGGSSDFQWDSRSVGISADEVSVTVEDGGTRLVIDVQNFEAGDVLVFGIDVDQFFSTKPDDQVTSGIEFAGSSFQTTFVDPHYNFNPDTSQTTGTFGYNFDFGADEATNSGVLTGLPTEDFIQGQNGSIENRTAGVMHEFDLAPKPISISGTVFHDRDLDVVQDAGEEGIEGVVLCLHVKDPATGQYSSVIHNGSELTAVTDANGDYEFGTDLGLTPGTYRIVEKQPTDFEFSTGSVAGTVDGTEVGISPTDNILREIEIPLGDMHAVDYDFGEVRTAKIGGYVYHDTNYNGQRDSGDIGIENVRLRLTGTDAFGNAHDVIGFTDANGHYCFDALPPGTYSVTEIQPEDFTDFEETVGSVGGTPVGDMPSNDRFTQITVGSEDEGVNYNFGEIKLGSISGHVHITTPDGRCVGPDSPEYRAIEGATVRLQDSTGQTWTTTTDEDGQYKFDGLRAGNYTVVEVTPSGYLDGAEQVGTINGVQVGTLSANDTISDIQLGQGVDAVNYDFCEREPAQICGVVYHDRNNNGIQDAGEEGIAGVTLRLMDSDLNFTGDEVTTNADGSYCFTELVAGEYHIQEIQPENYLDGIDTAGFVDGVATGMADSEKDEMWNILIQGGQQGTEYNFGEVLPGSIEGYVHTDPNGDCVFDESQGDRPIEGVLMQLRNEANEVIETARTDANGFYKFENLTPGKYTVRQVQPDGFVTSGETVGSGNGTAFTNRIANIDLNSDTQLVNYNFCEIQPSVISGYVHTDLDGNCEFDESAGEVPLENVLIQLVNADGDVIDSVRTDADGFYEFTDVMPGTYSLRQVQPDGLYDAGQVVGVDDVTGQTGSGVIADNMFTQLVIRGGESLTDYNFCELPPATIAGYVHTDLDGNCEFDESVGEVPIENTLIQLLDESGNVVDSVRTDADGFYEFGDIAPGTYSVRQVQPDGLFNAGQVVGVNERTGEAGSGLLSDNLMSEIVISGGETLVDYNFCELPPAELSGYVFQDGSTIFYEGDAPTTEEIANMRNGQFTNDDTPIRGVTLELRNGITGEIISGEQTLAGGTGAVRATTDENGFYHFTGLRPGNYAVFEIQPDGYIDNVDTAGTTDGIAINPTDSVDPFVLSTLADGVDPNDDAILRIALAANQHSQLNNFSEVLTEQIDDPVLPPPPVPEPPGNPRNPINPNRFVGGVGYGSAGMQSVSQNTLVVAGLGYLPDVTPETSNDGVWKLSVVNGGFPRGNDLTQKDGTSWESVGFLNATAWDAMDLSQGRFVYTTENLSEIGEKVSATKDMFYGLVDGLPIVGDFNGDGADEVGSYRNGEWYIDLTGNEVWDREDLWVRLGQAGELPVVGDWDGDGKDDIGVFGFNTDPDLIRMEPGIPDPANEPDTIAKNIPLNRQQRPDEVRDIKLTQRGIPRTDVVDHIFAMGQEGDLPVIGDWNGDGIRTTGLFQDGYWTFDVDGNGKIDGKDLVADYGQVGDLPVVGDFDGDGVEEIGVFRDGKWIVDTNRNFELDAQDKVFEMGQAGDQPVVGDFDGDGVDEPAVYRPQGNSTAQLNRAG